MSVTTTKLKSDIESTTETPNNLLYEPVQSAHLLYNLLCIYCRLLICSATYNMVYNMLYNKSATNRSGV